MKLKMIIAGLVALSTVSLAAFEDISFYCNSKLDRSYIIYTDETDEEKLIEYARTKDWERFQKTFVTFVNTKQGVESNSKYRTDLGKGIFLEGLIKNPNKKVVGTYAKTPAGKEAWFKGPAFVNGEPVDRFLDE